MNIYICKDLGFNCEYIVISEARVDVVQAAMLHAIRDHAEVTSQFSMEQSCEFLEAVEAAVHPELAPRIDPQSPRGTEKNARRKGEKLTAQAPRVP